MTATQTITILYFRFIYSVRINSMILLSPFHLKFKEGYNFDIEIVVQNIMNNNKYHIIKLNSKRWKYLM
jgi:hypothetical protein